MATLFRKSTVRVCRQLSQLSQQARPALARGISRSALLGALRQPPPGTGTGTARRALVALVSGTTLAAAVLKMEELFAVDELHKQCKYKEIYDMLKPREEANASNQAFQWRLARAQFCLGRQQKVKDEEKKMVLEAFELIKKTLAMNDSCGEAHLWYGIMLDQVGQYEGNKKRIEVSFEAEKKFRRAQELLPNNALVYHCLGVWHFEFADLPWLMRTVASMVYSSPPKTTYEQALELFLQAEKVEPGFYSKNAMLIGKCYVRLKKNAEAAEWLRKVRDWEIKIADDTDARNEAIELLKKAGIKD